MHHLKEGCCWFLKRQNGTKKQLLLILRAKVSQHGLYIYLSLNINGQSVTGLSLLAPPIPMQQICIISCQAIQKCKIVVNRTRMKAKGFLEPFQELSPLLIDLLPVLISRLNVPWCQQVWAWLFKLCTACFKLSYLNAPDRLRGSAMRTLPLYTQQGKNPSVERDSLYYINVHNKTLISYTLHFWVPIIFFKIFLSLL